MDSNTLITLITTVVGAFGVILTVMNQGRKSRWIQEQQLEEAKKTNGRITRAEELLNEHRVEIAEIKAELRHHK